MRNLTEARDRAVAILSGLSLRMATLAEQAGVAGELVWEEHWVCPNVHVGKAYWSQDDSFDAPMLCSVCRKPVSLDVSPRDLTNPMDFLRLVEAWLTRMRTWRLTSSWHWEGHGVWMSVMELLEDGVWSVRFVARDPDRTIAEAKVLCDAMEAEKGGD